MRLKPILFLLTVVGLVALLILRDQSGGPVRVGQLAPDFSVRDSAGNVVRFADYRGKVLLVNFWYTDCPPCKDEMPDLQRITDTFKDRKFQILPISVDVNKDDVTKFYAKYSLTMPWFWDPGRQVYSKFHATGYPETFLIDHNGHIRKHYVGAVNIQLMPLIEGYLREQETAEQASTR